MCLKFFVSRAPLGLFLGACLASAPVVSQQDDAAMETSAYIAERSQEFSRCVSDLKNRAVSEGLSQSVVNDVVGNLEFVPRVIELDRAQPEFTRTFTQYMNARITPQRIATGRSMLAKHSDLLSSLTLKYGVPGQYLVAFWGLETNFGGYMGDNSTLDSLATLGCDPRRSEYFTSELMSALRLIVDQGIDPESMRGSWAGAVGHTQFMPSNYAKYGIDGDGDGRVDLWGSEVDALTSAANFLQRLGWTTGERWGREVFLPEGFDYGNTGLDQVAPLSHWAELAVTRADGGLLPKLDLETAIVVPSGHQGPAFSAYSNFRVIMRWNRSEYYAISVGHLADRISGAGDLVAGLPDTPQLSRDLVTRVQLTLEQQGFDPNGVDGLYGSGTRAAVRAFQRQKGLIADGHLDASTLSEIERYALNIQ